MVKLLKILIHLSDFLFAEKKTNIKEYTNQIYIEFEIVDELGNKLGWDT